MSRGSRSRFPDRSAVRGLTSKGGTGKVCTRLLCLPPPSCGIMAVGQAPAQVCREADRPARNLLT